MIFALADFLQWKLRRGRYGERQTSVMGLGFEGTPPRAVVSTMMPGDLIFTQRLNRWFSWMMMYFASSSIDHCALYTGNGTVVHVTFSGTSEDPLRYVAKGARVIVCRPLDPRQMADCRAREPGWVTRFFHRYPAKVQLTWAAVEFVLGFYPERFRWRFLGDLVVLAAVVDLALWKMVHFPVLSALVLPLLGIALFNQLRWFVRRLRKRPPPLPASHPDLLTRPFFKGGGLMLTRIGPIVIGPFGTLPLRAVQAIARAAPDQEESSETAELREWFREMLVRLDALGEPEADPTNA
jgi:hypothetical protein